MSATTRVENGQVSPRKRKLGYGYLREDGIYPLPLFHVGRDGAAMTGSPFTDPANYCVFEDDFVGTAAQPAWTALDTAGATEAVLTDESEAHGVLALTLTNADEAQRAAYTFNDLQCIPLAKKPIMDIRWKLKVLPVLGTEASEVRFGLGSAYNVANASIADGLFCGFDAHASTNGLLKSYLNNNSAQTITSSGLTIVNTNWHWTRFDLSNLAACKIYHCISDAGAAQTQIHSTTTLSLSGRTTYMQPILSCAKSKSAANTSTGQLYIDYVRILWQR